MIHLKYAFNFLKSNIYLCRFFSILLFLTLSLIAHAETQLPSHKINLANTTTTINANKYFYFLADNSNNQKDLYSFEKVSSGQFNPLFKKEKFDQFSRHQWFQAHLDISSNESSIMLYVPVQALLLHDFRIWVTTNGQTKDYQLGFEKSPTSYNETGLHFSIPLSSGVNHIIGYVENGSLLFNLPLTITTKEVLAQKNLQFENFTFAFYAIFAVLFLYNLSLWISLKENVYGIYLVFLLSCSTLLFFIDGSAFRAFPTISHISLFHFHMINSIFSSLVYAIFAFLSLEQISQWRKFRQCFMLIFLLGFLSILYNYFHYADFSAIILSQLYGSLVFLTIFSSLIYGIHKKIRMAYYLLIAELGVLIGGTLTNYPLNFDNSYSMWYLHAGFLWEAVFLSLALAEKTRAAKEAVVKTLSKFQKIYQSTPQGLFSYNLSMNTYECNNTWAQMHGFNSQADLNIDYVLNSFAENIENENVESLIEKMRLHNEISNVIYRPPNPYGSYSKTLILTMRIIEDENNDLSIIEGSANDITEVLMRKNVETEKAIIISNSESKNSFFASINHELRTPLTSILGYAQAIQGEDIPLQDKEKGIMIIERSGKHLLQLINDLLDLSKLEAKKLSVEKLQVPLFDLFFEIEDYFGILADSKKIRFSIDFQYPMPATIESDPTRFKQILLNLCSNALKFTENGFIKITVLSNRQLRNLTINVEDSGIGLTEEQQENLFQAYTQADQTIARKFGGTGLGLSLSKQLAQLLGGDITVSSIPKKGSTFTLTISTGDLSQSMWLEKAPSTSRKYTQDLSHSPSMQTETNTTPLRPLHILVAEDNEDSQDILSIFLAKANVDLTIVNNGQLALDAIDNSKSLFLYDLVLMDLQMPVMDGVSAMKALRAKGITLPIIAFTASGDAQAEYEGQGFDGFLSKPINKERLLDCVNRYRSKE